MPLSGVHTLGRLDFLGKLLVLFCRLVAYISLGNLFNPHPDVVNNHPKSLGGESGIVTQGLAPYFSPPNMMVPF